MMFRLAASVGIALSVWLVGGSAPKSTPAPEPCPDSAPTRGVYRNYNYGFTVTFPPGVDAFWNSAACHSDPQTGECACMTDHGREIPLGDHAYIVVFASYTNPDAMSGPTRVILDLDRFRGSSKPPEFDVSFLETYRLGSLTGFRYVAAIDQPNGRVVREAIVVVSADEGIEVTVAIQGPQAVYHARRPVLQSILKSWRASPRM